mmetsp:Transcript_28180/g.71851  ORF Transcript_28180/g.71851 Transcript_28180/m.71851 type:complete len:216 (+) Transcript_28180:2174-2821(+)
MYARADSLCCSDASSERPVYHVNSEERREMGTCCMRLYHSLGGVTNCSVCFTSSPNCSKKKTDWACLLSKSEAVKSMIATLSRNEISHHVRWLRNTHYALHGWLICGHFVPFSVSSSSTPHVCFALVAQQKEKWRTSKQHAERGCVCVCVFVAGFFCVSIFSIEPPGIALLYESSTGFSFSCSSYWLMLSRRLFSCTCANDNASEIRSGCRLCRI